MINNSFWKNKSIFITGHSGFKGSWLCLWLSLLGSKITGYSFDNFEKNSLFNKIKIKEKLDNNFFGDVTDYEYLEKKLKKSNPEIIIHMAAQPLVIDSFIDPVSTYNTNVMGTVNLLQASRNLKNCKVILIVTSDKSYKNNENQIAYKETDILNGADPYSNSKSCADLVVSSFRKSFYNIERFGDHNVSLASARAGNVIGAGDWAHNRLIPDLVKSLMTNKKFIIRNSKSIRPWQHVLESLSGYMCLIENMWQNGIKYSDAWNFGPDTKKPKEVQWIVKKFIEVWGNKIDILEDDKKSFISSYESKLLKLDITKSQKYLFWKPKWDIEKSLKITAEGYKALLNEKNFESIFSKQIKEYSNNN